MNLLDEWNNLNPLTDAEKYLLNMEMSHKPEATTDWNNIPVYTKDEKVINSIVQQYFDLMPGCNIDTTTHKMLFNNCCSDFIRDLFKIHVDDNTLVISSDCEHPTVKDCLSQCKNTLILGQHQDIRGFDLAKIKTALRDYNKVFVYIISVRNDTGEITPQSFMKQLKELIKDKEHFMVLDAVQSMFLTPCDYSLYDYVLGTGHVIVPAFDMGMAICRKENQYLKNEFISNWSTFYLQPLKIVLKRLEKLYKFRYACNEHFKQFINNDNISQACAVPYIFYVQADQAKIDPEIKIEKFHTLIMPNSTKVGGIRLRALGFISNPEYLKTAQYIMKYVLNNKVLDENVFKELL